MASSLGSGATASSGGLAIVDSILSDFPELRDEGRLSSDREYMRLKEARFLVVL
jgi:hypothetical protein